jgi:hypothetical protein
LYSTSESYPVDIATSDQSAVYESISDYSRFNTSSMARAESNPAYNRNPTYHQNRNPAYQQNRSQVPSENSHYELSLSPSYENPLYEHSESVLNELSDNPAYAAKYQVQSENSPYELSLCPSYENPCDESVPSELSDNPAYAAKYHEEREEQGYDHLSSTIYHQERESGELSDNLTYQLNNEKREEENQARSCDSAASGMNAGCGCVYLPGTDEPNEKSGKESPAQSSSRGEREADDDSANPADEYDENHEPIQPGTPPQSKNLDNPGYGLLSTVPTIN